MKKIFLLAIILILSNPLYLYSDCNRGRMPENGDWVSYIIYSNKERMELKLAIVGEENYNGNKALWFELIARSGELDFIIKRLVIGDPLTPEKVLRQIVKIINKTRPDYSPALEIPINSSDSKADKTLQNFPCIDRIGEKIKYKFKKNEINAFSYKSEKPKSMIIYSKELPFFGVVKAESDNMKIELVDYGRNAFSEINEKPIRLIENPAQTDTNDH